MPGATGKGYPYPTPTDPINAYPALGQDLAARVDAHDHGVPDLPAELRRRVASPFPQAGQLVVLFDRVQATTDATGTGRVSFPTAFPNVLALQVTPVVAGGAAVVIVVSVIDASGFTFKAYGPLPPATGPWVGNLGLSYLAMGSV